MGLFPLGVKMDKFLAVSRQKKSTMSTSMMCHLESTVIEKN